MKNTPQELKELFPNSPDAIERMLLVTMLQEALAGRPVAGAALHGVMEATHPKPKTVSEILKENRTEIIEKVITDIGNIMHRLRISSDGCKTVEDLPKGIERALTGWRVPQRGDRLRLIKPVSNLIYSHDWITVGDIVTCEAIGACIDSSIAIPADTKNGWLLQTLPGVQFLKPGDDSQISCLPLDCFEPVTEE